MIKKKNLSVKLLGWCATPKCVYGRMAESADALGSNPSIRKDVWVQIPL